MTIKCTKAHNKSFKSLCKKAHSSDEQKAARRLTQRYLRHEVAYLFVELK